jgi:hypothetical protein
MPNPVDAAPNPLYRTAPPLFDDDSWLALSNSVWGMIGLGEVLRFERTIHG